jgi:hypothetical protein
MTQAGKSVFLETGLKVSADITGITALASRQRHTNWSSKTSPNVLIQCILVVGFKSDLCKISDGLSGLAETESGSKLTYKMTGSRSGLDPTKYNMLVNLLNFRLNIFLKENQQIIFT